jgi:hypothetical protein
MHDLKFQSRSSGAAAEEKLSVPVEKSKKRKQNNQGAPESTKKRPSSNTTESNQQSKLSQVISAFQARSKVVKDSSVLLRCILRRKITEAAILLESIESLSFGVSTSRTQHLSGLTKDIQETMKPLSVLLSQSNSVPNSSLLASVPLLQSCHIASVIGKEVREEFGKITLVGLLARVVDSDSSHGVLLTLVALVKNTGKADARSIYFTATSQPEHGISCSALKVRSAKIPKLSPNRSVFVSALIILPLECFQTEVRCKNRIGVLHNERTVKISIGLNWINCCEKKDIHIGYHMANCIVRETDIVVRTSNVLSNVKERISSYDSHHSFCEKFPLVCPLSPEKFQELFEELVKPLDTEDLVFYSFLHIQNGCFQSSNETLPDKSKFKFSVSSALSYLQRDFALCGPLFYSSMCRSSDADDGVAANVDFVQSVKELEFCFRGASFVLLAPDDSTSDSAVPAFIVSLNASSVDRMLRTIKANLMPEVSLKLLPAYCQRVIASGSFDTRQGLIRALLSIVKEMQQLSVAFREMAKRVRDNILRSAPTVSDLVKSKRGPTSIPPAPTMNVNGSSSSSTQKFAVLNPRLVCFDPLLLFRIIDTSEDSDLAVMELMSNIRL